MAISIRLFDGTGGPRHRWPRTLAAAAAATAALIVTVVVIACLPGGGAREDDTTTIIRPAESAAVQCPSNAGAVASDAEPCSTLGSSILRAGGNAIDAAVTTALCLGVVHPESSGLGGGTFILIRLANGTAEVIDAREEAPASAYETMFIDELNASSTFGGRSVAVPAELAGLRMAWERHGRLPWAQLVEPVAALAEEAPVDQTLAEGLASSAWLLRASSTAAAAVATFFVREGDAERPLRAGETLRNVELAATLRAIAKDGVEALRAGPIAEAIVQTVRQAGGNLTLADLQRYSPVVREPLTMEAMGTTFLGVPPPSSGGATVLQALRFLSGFEMPLASASPALSAHRTVEALKHAFALRMRLGDPAFVPGTAEVVRDMLSAAFNDELRAGESDTATRPLGEYGGRMAPNVTLPSDSGTSHASVVDGDGNAVAFTTTINTAFGSKLLVGGFVLNNEMDDFSTPGRSNAYGLAPSEANYIRPGKRPLSSMSPTIAIQPALVNGSATTLVRAAVGASGGSKIISATLQALARYLLRDRDARAAVSESRVHHQFLPNVVYVEDFELLDGTWEVVPESVREGLRARGHVVRPWGSHAVVQAVVRDLDTLELTAVSDARKGGVPSCG